MVRSNIGRRAALLGGLASVTASAAPADAAIPIELDGGRCLVTVLLDGRPARMLLDTGAERTIMNHAAAVRLGLRPDRWVATTLRGAGGLLERYANVDVAVARIGSARLFQDQSGNGLSLPVTSADLGGVDGLLGGDVLRHHVLELDVPRRRLTLRAVNAMTPAADAAPLRPLRRDLLLAPVRLDGHALTALVDTGAAASLVNARGLYRLGLSPAQTAHDAVVAIHGVGGASPARLHRFAELRVGALRVAAPTMLTQTVPEPAFDLVLGLDVLGRQRMVLSYQALVLEFE